MPYNPKNALVLKAEIQINGVWTTVTSRARSAGKVRIKHGMSDGASGPETSRMRCVIGNDDGWLTEDNPSSPWWPYFGRGTPIRLSLTGILGSDAGRFAGEIDRLEAIYPGGSSSAVYVEAIGTWGTLAQDDDELRSPMFRSMAGIAAGDYTPDAYWPMEDGAGAVHFASGLPGGQPVQYTGSVQVGADDEMLGSLPLPTFEASAYATASIPALAASGQWMLQFAFKIPEEPAATTEFAEIRVVDGFWSKHVVKAVPGTPSYLYVDNYVNEVFSSGSGIEIDSELEPFIFGQWVMVSFSEIDIGGGFVDALADFHYFRDGELISGGIGTLETGPVGRPVSVKLMGGNGMSFGHMAMFSDPNFNYTTDASLNAAAMTGYSGETVEERIDRLAREEGVNVTVVGDSSHLMGPQQPARLTDLFTDCQKVDQGIWSDDLTAIALVYRTSSHLYNQTAALAIQRGSLTPDTAPIWDYQRIANEWIVSRDGGSSSTQSDEDHVAKVRRRVKRSETINVSTDDVLDNHARWRVNLGTAPGPRYPVFGINLRNTDGATLADSVLALDPGDRFTAAAAAFPIQHPPDGADQLATGWDEELDADFWEFRPVAVPARPYTVGEVDSNTRVSSEGSTLSGSLTSTGTSFSLASTAANGVWTTSGADFPLDINIGGERVRLSGISGSSSPQTATVAAGGRSLNGVVKAHSSGASVDVWEPAIVAL